MPRYATVRTLYDPQSPATNAQILDPNAIVLFFPAPRSATGEDVLELHIHGGRAIVNAVLNAISRTFPPLEGREPSLRYAEPGEFTRRAFYNNRLDLTQIEALGDTLSAETEQQRRLAVRGATTTLSVGYESWRKELLYARGELEAIIDFSEDQHFDEPPERLLETVAIQVDRLRKRVESNIQNSFRGELLRSGISIALVGAPNAGKSSLLNRIVQREASIVSKEEGTTRDVVEVGVDIGGFYCRFGDLAGLRENSRHRETIGEIEMEGMRRARTYTVAADVIVLVLSAEEVVKEENSLINPDLETTLKSCNLDKQKVVCVINKSDLLRGQTSANEILLRLKQHSAFTALATGDDNLLVFFVSCKEAEIPQSDHQDSGGIRKFLEGLLDLFKAMTSPVQPRCQDELTDPSMWEQSLGSNERQRLLLQQCLQSLQSFLATAEVTKGDDDQHTTGEEIGVDIVVAAEHLRDAADCLARITGQGEAGDVEEVLGVVFEKYVGHLSLWNVLWSGFVLKIETQILCRQIMQQTPVHAMLPNKEETKLFQNQHPIKSNLTEIYPRMINQTHNQSICETSRFSIPKVHKVLTLHIQVIIHSNRKGFLASS